MRIEDAKRRYIALYGEDPTTIDTINEIESTLQISLPTDVKEIASFYGGGILGGIEHTAIEATGPGSGIVDTTVAFRSAIGLPNHLVVLADHSESVIFLDVSSGAVTWVDAADVVRLANGQSPVGWTKSWPSYADFFEYLLAEEEREREIGNG